MTPLVRRLLCTAGGVAVGLPITWALTGDLSASAVGATAGAVVFLVIATITNLGAAA